MPSSIKGHKRSPELSPITEQEIKYAHLLMCGKHTDMAAAELAGFNRNFASRLKFKPRVQQYMLLYRTQFATMMANQELAAIRKFDISRTSLIQLNWTLANLPPERTRDTISGQVEASREVAELLGLHLKPEGNLKGMTDEQLREYLLPKGPGPVQ